MAQEEYRLAGAALALGRFTLQGLAQAAKVKRSTAGSWFRRHADYFELHCNVSGRRRPSKMWRFRRGAEENLRLSLEALHRQFIPLTTPDARPPFLSRIERQLEAWRASKQAGDSASYEQQQLVLHTLLRIAWEDLAEDFRLRGDASAPLLKRVAEIERDAGLGNLPESNHLPAVAKWIAESLSRMTKRGVAIEFSARVLRARAEARHFTDQVKLTAAALAAPVWSDERRGEVPELQLGPCAIVAEIVPTAQRLQEIALAIDARPSFGYCKSADESQAVVLGLATRPDARSVEVSNWLNKLDVSNLWQRQFAPAVLQGLAEAPGINLGLLVRKLADPLELELRSPTGLGAWAGALRRAAYEFSRRIAATGLYRTDFQVSEDPEETIFENARILFSSPLSATEGEQP